MPVSELFQPVNPAFTQKEIDPVWKNGNFCYLSRIKFQEKKIYRFEWSNYSNLLELSYNTKSSALWLLQRYKSCYSRAGINHKHLVRKGLLARRDERSGTSQILFLHHWAAFLLLSDIFLQQKQCHLQKCHWEKTTIAAPTSTTPPDYKGFWHGFYL